LSFRPRLPPSTKFVFEKSPRASAQVMATPTPHEKRWR
jgi:hypothetical protein